MDNCGIRGRITAGERLTGRLAGGTGGGVSYEIGPGLKVEDGVLSVDTADAVEEDNTKPITSAAVYTELGGVEALLANI